MSISGEYMEAAASLARSGEKERAQYVFAQIVENDPENAYAWLWLSELTNDLEDQTRYLDLAIRYLPTRPDGCKDLQGALNEIHGFIPLPAWQGQLQAQPEPQPALPPSQAFSPSVVFQQAERWFINGKRAEALELLRDLIEAGSAEERVWQLYSEISPDLAQKINALEKIVLINPQNAAAASRLAHLKQRSHQPLQAALYLEDQGEHEQALEVMKAVSAQAAAAAEQAEIKRHILRLETRLITGQPAAYSPVPPNRFKAMISKAKANLFG